MVVGGVLEWLVGAGYLRRRRVGSDGFHGCRGQFCRCVGREARPGSMRSAMKGGCGVGTFSFQFIATTCTGQGRRREILKRAGGDDVSSTSRVAEDLGITCLACRPVNERTVASVPLRLVTNRYLRATGA